VTSNGIAIPYCKAHTLERFINADLHHHRIKLLLQLGALRFQVGDLLSQPGQAVFLRIQFPGIR
jgi:hypothetical protein